jgi:hypothetical protein
LPLISLFVWNSVPNHPVYWYEAAPIPMFRINPRGESDLTKITGMLHGRLQ